MNGLMLNLVNAWQLKTFDLCLHQRPSLCSALRKCGLVVLPSPIHADRRLDDQHCKLIVQLCKRNSCRPASAMFPLHLLEEGQRHPVNMNVNEAMPNRCMAKQALGKTWLRDGKGHWQGALRG
jgi:hypothetical protein